MTSQPFFFGAQPRTRLYPTGSPRVRGGLLTLLAALTAGLSAAFVYVPRLVAGGGFADQRALITALRDAFVGFWGSGSRTPAMQRIIDYWFRYHVAKAVIAALLLGVLVTLALLLWKTYSHASLAAPGKAAIVAAWSIAATLALSSAAVVAANIQGAVAPFSSLMSMLPAAKPDAPFTATLHEVKQGLTHYSSANSRAPLNEMVDDFTLYHATLVAVATILALVLIAVSVSAWRRFGRVKGDRMARRAYAAFAIASVAASLLVIVIAVADLTTVANPAPALLAAFQGSW